MSMNIFASRYEDHAKYGQMLVGVLHHKHWDETIVAEDADARFERDEDPFVPNPDFIPHSGLNLANDNVHALLGQMGLKLDEDSYLAIELDELEPLVLKALGGDAVHHEVPPSRSTGKQGCQIVDMGIPRGYMGDRLARLYAMIQTGREHGATHMTFA